MSVKADIEKAVADVRDHVDNLQNVPRDLVARVEAAVERLSIEVRELVHIPVDEPVGEPKPKAAKAVKADVPKDEVATEAPAKSDTSE